MTGTRKHYNDGFEGPPLEAGITWWPGEGQSIEAGTGETEGLDAKRESDGALQAQAPNTPVTLPIHGEMREALERIAGSWTQFNDEPGNALASGYKTQRDMMQQIARNALTSNTGSSS